MNTTWSRPAGMLLAALALGGCSGDEAPSDGASTTPTTSTAATSSPSGSTTITPERTGPDGIEAKARAELDGRVNDDRSYTLAGTKTAFEVPLGWTIGSGTWKVATSGAQQETFTAATVAKGETAAAKRDQAATTLSLSSCTWSTPESVKLGEQRLAAKVADGVCKRGEAAVGAVVAEISGKGPTVIAVGAWDKKAGSHHGVFAILRSVTGESGGKGSGGIAACCAALDNNAKVAPLDQRGNYLAAAAGCRAVVNDPRGKAALRTALAQLKGAKIPAPCQ